MGIRALFLYLYKHFSGVSEACRTGKVPECFLYFTYQQDGQSCVGAGIFHDEERRQCSYHEMKFEFRLGSEELRTNSRV